jgi:GAF domain-containing protein
MSATLHKDIIRAPRQAESAQSFAMLAELVQRYLGCDAAVLSVDDPLAPVCGKVTADRSSRCASAAFRQGRQPSGIDVTKLANPLVAGAMGMHFYAGLPLRDCEGRSIGMLAAMDHHERRLDADELQALKLLAEMAGDLYEMQRLGAA